MSRVSYPSPLFLFSILVLFISLTAPVGAFPVSESVKVEPEFGAIMDNIAHDKDRDAATNAASDVVDHTDSTDYYASPLTEEEICKLFKEYQQRHVRVDLAHELVKQLNMKIREAIQNGQHSVQLFYGVPEAATSGRGMGIMTSGEFVPEQACVLNFNSLAEEQQTLEYVRQQYKGLLFSAQRNQRFVNRNRGLNGGGNGIISGTMIRVEWSRILREMNLIGFS